MKDNTTIGSPIPILPRRRITDAESLERTIELVVERSNNKVLGEMRAMNRNLERAVSRLLKNIDGVAKSEKEVAVAGIVEGEHDDLPRLSRVKADPALVYTLKTKDIAKRVGVTTMRASYLLNKTGLDWVGRKGELWSTKMHEVSGTRLWHPKTADLLQAVLNDPKHPERKHATPGCKKYLRNADAERSA